MIIWSAFFLLLAAHAPVTLGWFVMPGIALLFVRKLRLSAVLAWCAILLFGHLWWIAGLAYWHMSASLASTLFLYILILGWLWLVSALFWVIGWSAPLRSRIRLALLLPLYFYLLAHASTPFLSGIRGYPFANPILPLIAWWRGADAQEGSRWHQVTNGLSVYPLPQLKKKTRVGRVQELMLAINAIPPAPQNAETNIIVAPESALPYANVANPTDFKIIASCLPKGHMILFGGIDQNLSGCRQAAFLVKNCLITHKLIKKTCVDFFETTPRESKIGRFLMNYMDWKTEEFVSGAEQAELISMNGLKIQVLLCAEAIWGHWDKRADVTFILLNETWFLSWVQELFYAAIRWKSWWQGGVVVAVGHTRCIFMRFE